MAGGKFFWFLLFNLLTLIYFTFFGKSGFACCFARLVLWRPACPSTCYLVTGQRCVLPVFYNLHAAFSNSHFLQVYVSGSEQSRYLMCRC